MPDGEEAAQGGRNLSPHLFSGAPHRLEPKQPEEAPPSVDDDDEVVRGPEEKFAHLYDNEDRKLPHGMAELYVYPVDSTVNGNRGFGLRAASCCSTVRNVNDPRRAYGRPKLDLGTQIAPGGTPPAKFLRRMTAWSYDQVNLTDWLDKRRQDHGTLELMVWDDTGFRIPWELLWLPADSEDEKPAGDYLGAVVTVTRWLSLHPYPRNRNRVRKWTNTAPYQAGGRVAAYIHKDMRADEALFDRFDLESAADMEDLFRRLKVATPPGALALAMVYVACHGEFSDDPEDCALDGFSYGRATQFNDDLIRLREQATLVFLNGCHTGSIGVDMGTYNDDALRGFAKVFLRSGTTGVLATTGAVGIEEARVLADDLLSHLGSHRELSVAEAVRQLRADAAIQMTEDLLRTNLSKEAREQADKKLHQLLYSFMYVYFGSPRMLLSLAERGGLADTGELAGTGAQP